MSKSLIGRLMAAAPGSVIGALIFVVSPALARNFAPPAGTPPAGTITAAAFVPTDSPFFIYFLLVLFGFGALLIGGILFYIYKIQMRYYNLAQRLSQLGEGVRASPVATFEKQAAKLLADKAVGQQEPLKIDGPGFVPVGASADFTVTTQTGDAANEAQWSVDPENAVGLSAATGAKVTARPLTMGSFKLSAVLVAPNAAGSVLVTAVASQTTSEELPFIGQGYGSLAIAVLVVIAVVVLSLTGILTGEAVATLFGGLLGYIFGVTTSAGGKSAGGSGGSSPGAGG